MGSMQRRKGKTGEREAAAEISRLFGVEARRGQQFRGGGDSPDVVHGLAGLHLEVKRTESLRIWPAIEQATEDAGEQVPAVLHRPNNRPWLFICRLEDLPRVAAIIAKESADAFRSQCASEMRQEQPASDRQNG